MTRKAGALLRRPVKAEGPSASQQLRYSKSHDTGTGDLAPLQKDSHLIVHLQAASKGGKLILSCV